jgi:hypothetical protein
MLKGVHVDGGVKGCGEGWWGVDGSDTPPHPFLDIFFSWTTRWIFRSGEQKLLKGVHVGEGSRVVVVVVMV